MGLRNVARQVPTQRNPMELVTVKNASQRMRKHMSLKAEQFHALLEKLESNLCFRTMLLLAASFGLCISEVLGLKWRDVDWLNKTLRIQRGVVKQIVDDVKSVNSARNMVCGICSSCGTKAQSSPMRRIGCSYPRTNSEGNR